MLSDETANGKYPTEAVAAMKKIILYTQDHSSVASIDFLPGLKTRQDAISNAAVHLAERLNSIAIVAETKSGSTAANIAAHRPNLPIISVTSEPRAARQLALSYANRSYVRPDGEKAGYKIAKELKDEGFFGDADTVSVVIVSGRQPGVTGGTDTIKVRMVE
jgi:pyruvate kinase